MGNRGLRLRVDVCPRSGGAGAAAGYACRISGEDDLDYHCGEARPRDGQSDHQIKPIRESCDLSLVGRKEVNRDKSHRVGWGALIAQEEAGAGARAAKD